MLKFLQEENIESKEIYQLSKWKILIVDDEKEVHITTESVLKKFTFEDRGLEFLHAYTPDFFVINKVLDTEKEIVCFANDEFVKTFDARWSKLRGKFDACEGKTPKIHEEEWINFKCILN